MVLIMERSYFQGDLKAGGSTVHVTGVITRDCYCRYEYPVSSSGDVRAAGGTDVCHESVAGGKRCQDCTVGGRTFPAPNGVGKSATLPQVLQQFQVQLFFFKSLYRYFLQTVFSPRYFCHLIITFWML